MFLSRIPDMEFNAATHAVRRGSTGVVVHLAAKANAEISSFKRPPERWPVLRFNIRGGKRHPNKNSWNCHEAATLDPHRYFASMGDERGQGDCPLVSGRTAIETRLPMPADRATASILQVHHIDIALDLAYS